MTGLQGDKMAEALTHTSKSLIRDILTASTSLRILRTETYLPIEAKCNSI